MTSESADTLTTLRGRLFELVTWFCADGQRLLAAQDRRKLDPRWRGLLEHEIEQLLVELDERDDRGALRAPLIASAMVRPTASAGAFELLVALEALDQVAWLWAGGPRNAPATRFGDGADARVIVRLARERRASNAAQSGLLCTHLRHHAVVKTRVDVADGRSFSVRVIPVTDERCKVSSEAVSVSVATTSFGDGGIIDWSGDNGSAATVNGAEARTTKLVEAVVKAAAGGVDILVAPELTVPPAERDVVLRKLRWKDGPSLFVPGSFHEEIKGADGSSQIYNRAVLVDRRGRQLCEHRKLVRFGKLDGVRDEAVEAIQIGSEIALLVTPLGTVAVAICKDSCDDFLQALWHEIQPEWLLVPAYGPGASAHEAAARRVGRMTGTVTVLAHEGSDSSKEEARSFVHDVALMSKNCFAPAFAVHNVLFFHHNIDIDPPDGAN